MSTDGWDQVERIAEALDYLDAAMDATHPEGHGCDLCKAADELRAIVEGSPATPPSSDAGSPIDVDRLARALRRVGASDIEQMAWSPLAYPIVYEGDPALNVIREDPFPMASLARAIAAEYAATPPTPSPDSPR
jgi:hypothetical protein